MPGRFRIHKTAGLQHRRENESSADDAPGVYVTKREVTGLWHGPMRAEYRALSISMDAGPTAKGLQGRLASAKLWL